MKSQSSESSNGKRVTIKEGGKAAGKSGGTGVLLIQDHQRTSLETGRKTNGAARKRGSRNRVLQKPAGSTIAWINYWPEPWRLRDQREFDEYWKGARITLEQHGFALEEFVWNERLSVKWLRRVMRARNVRGLLLPPSQEMRAMNWGSFDWNEYAVVRFGRTLPTPPAYTVTSDHVGNAMLAFQKMRELGYERIGFVGRRPSYAWRFVLGYLLSQIELQEVPQLPPLWLATDINENDKPALAAWLKKNKPDAILTELPGLRTMLSMLGMCVPKDIGLAALSVLDGGADAGIYQHPGSIGKAAAEVMVALINRGERGIPSVCRTTLVHGEWTDGFTLPARKPGPIVSNRNLY